MTKNIIGFSLSENTESIIKDYDNSIENRQSVLEDKINSLIIDFQQKEKVVVLVDYDTSNIFEKPITTRLIVDLKA